MQNASLGERGGALRHLRPVECSSELSAAELRDLRQRCYLGQTTSPELVAQLCESLLAYILEERESLSDLKDDLSASEDKISEIEAERDKLESERDELESERDKLKERVTCLERDLEQIREAAASLDLP